MERFSLIPLIYALVIILGFIGEIRCIYKAIKCDWNPIGKAEILYTGSAITGLGCITGWFDIKNK